MCEGKKKCSCGCKTKKPISESKKILKEGTWAPTVWDDNVALQAKNILRGMIDTFDSVDIAKLINRFEKKFWNKIGDDEFYDYLDQASSEFSRGYPNWKNNIEKASQRVDQLAEIYKKEGKVSDNTFKVNETATSVDKLPKQAKFKLHCDKCDLDFDANFKKTACPKCGVISNHVLNEGKQKRKILEKINLKLPSNTKTEFVKQAKVALDAIYTLYVKMEKKDVDNEVFLNLIDNVFEDLNRILVILISQQSVD